MILKNGLNYADIRIGEKPVQRIYAGENLVWERNGLPDGYTRCEYIESSGSQWIKTNWIPTNSNTISVVFKITNYFSDFRPIYGVYYSVNSNVSCWYKNGALSWNEAPQRSLLTSTDVLYTSKVHGKTAELYFDDKIYSYAQNYELLDDAPVELPIFVHYSPAKRYVVERCSAIKLYHFEGYDGNIPKLNLIPCYRNFDFKPGLYDTVTKTFFVNQGSGEFGYEAADGTYVAPY